MALFLDLSRHLVTLVCFPLQSLAQSHLVLLKRVLEDEHVEQPDGLQGSIGASLDRNSLDLAEHFLAADDPPKDGVLACATCQAAHETSCLDAYHSNAWSPET